MTKEAELNAESDRKRKEAVETKNQLDSITYQLEKTLKEAGDKVPADKKTAIEAAIGEAKKALESDDADKMKAAMENLSKVGADLYAAAGAAGAAPGADAAQGASGAAAGAASSDEGKKTEKKANVVDADFEVVDEDKK